MDEVFGGVYFKNEITWLRVLGGKNDAQQYGRSSDKIFFCTKSDQFTFKPPRLSEVNDSWYNRVDDRGRYVSRPLTASGATAGDSGQPWRGIAPTGHWIVPELLAARYRNETGNALVGTVRERLEELANANYIEFSYSGLPSWRRYLDEANAPRVQDMWYDDAVKPIGRTGAERTNYPTQKPQALLDRIINASSNEGDLVLDCFVRLWHYGGGSRKAQPPLDCRRSEPVRHLHHPQAAAVPGQRQALLCPEPGAVRKAAVAVCRFGTGLSAVQSWSSTTPRR